MSSRRIMRPPANGRDTSGARHDDVVEMCSPTGDGYHVVGDMDDSCYVQGVATPTATAMLGATRHRVQHTPVNAPGPHAPRHFTFDANDANSHLAVGVVQQEVNPHTAVGAVLPGLRAWQTMQPFDNLVVESLLGIPVGIMPYFMGGAAPHQPGVDLGGNLAAGPAAGLVQSALPPAIPAVGAAAANTQDGAAPGAALATGPAVLPAIMATLAAAGPAVLPAITATHAAAGPTALPAITATLAAAGPADAPAQGALPATIPAFGAAAANTEGAATTASPAAPAAQNAAPAILTALGAAAAPAQGAVPAAIPAATSAQGVPAAGATLAAGPAAPAAEDAFPAAVVAATAPAGTVTGAVTAPAQDTAPAAASATGAIPALAQDTASASAQDVVSEAIFATAAPATPARLKLHSLDSLTEAVACEKSPVCSAVPACEVDPASTLAVGGIATSGPPGKEALSDLLGSNCDGETASLASKLPPVFFPTHSSSTAQPVAHSLAPIISDPPAANAAAYQIGDHIIGPPNDSSLPLPQYTGDSSFSSPAQLLFAAAETLPIGTGSKTSCLNAAEVAAPNDVGVHRTIGKVGIPAGTMPAVPHKGAVPKKKKRVHKKKKNAAKLEDGDGDFARDVSGDQQSAAARGGRFVASNADAEKETTLEPKRAYTFRTALDWQNNAWKWNADENAAFDLFFFPMMTIEGWNEDTLAMSRATGRNRQQVRSHKFKKFQKWHKDPFMATHVPVKGGTPPNPLVSIYTIKPEWAPEPDTEAEEPHVLSLEEFQAKLQDYMIDGRVKWDRVRGIPSREPEILQELAQEALTFGPHTFDESSETDAPCIRPGFERAFNTMQAFFIEITDRIIELVEEGVISEERALAEFCIDLRQGGDIHGANGGGANGGDTNGGGANGSGGAELDMDL